MLISWGCVLIDVGHGHICDVGMVIFGQSSVDFNIGGKLDCFGKETLIAWECVINFFFDSQ